MPLGYVWRVRVTTTYGGFRYIGASLRATVTQARNYYLGSTYLSKVRAY